MREDDGRAMIHIRTDYWPDNARRTFACGIGPALPEGDKWFHTDEIGSHYRVDCPGCRPHAAQLGTPISELATRPDGTVAGQRRYERWVEIGRSWGYP